MVENANSNSDVVFSATNSNGVDLGQTLASQLAQSQEQNESAIQVDTDQVTGQVDTNQEKKPEEQKFNYFENLASSLSNQIKPPEFVDNTGQRQFQYQPQNPQQQPNYFQQQQQYQPQQQNQQQTSQEQLNPFEGLNPDALSELLDKDPKAFTTELSNILTKQNNYYKDQLNKVREESLRQFEQKIEEQNKVSFLNEYNSKLNNSLAKDNIYLTNYDKASIQKEIALVGDDYYNDYIQKYQLYNSPALQHINDPSFLEAKQAILGLGGNGNMLSQMDFIVMLASERARQLKSTNKFQPKITSNVPLVNNIATNVPTGKHQNNVPQAIDMNSIAAQAEKERFEKVAAIFNNQRLQNNS